MGDNGPDGGMTEQEKDLKNEEFTNWLQKTAGKKIIGPQQCHQIIDEGNLTAWESRGGKSKEGIPEPQGMRAGERKRSALLNCGQSYITLSVTLHK